jgi:peptidoglycan L-alanyl-D-glutamate endopeptidase CwlK
MPSFGKRSKGYLDTVHPDIQLVLNEAIKYIDFSITDGVRTVEQQQALFNRGVTKCDGIEKKSKHQAKDDGYSHAVDIAPYPLDYTEDNKKRARFYFLMGVIEGISRMFYDRGLIDCQMRYGLDWDSDRHFNDQSFDDLPHFEMRIV